MNVRRVQCGALEDCECFEGASREASHPVTWTTTRAGRQAFYKGLFHRETLCHVKAKHLIEVFCTVFGSLVLFARSGQMTDSMGLAMIWNVASLALAAKTNNMSPSSLVLCF